MKKCLLLTATAIAAFLIGCTKNGDDPDNGNNGNPDEAIKVSLSVSGIGNNQATISASLTQGVFYGAKIIEAVNINYVDIDPSNQVQLINYVKANGVDVSLPYSNTLTGLKADTEMFTAVIVYDDEGLATDSAYQTWTVVGSPDSWSEDANAGNLDEIEW